MIIARNVYLYIVAFIFGIIAQFPIMLVSTISNMWFVSNNITKTNIGLSAIAMIPLSLEFLWPYIVTHFHVPIMRIFVTQNKEWLLCAQLVIGLGSVILSYLHPQQHFLIILFVLLMISMFCGCNHAIFYMYYNKNESTNVSFGYAVAIFAAGCRIGMLLANNTIMRIANAYGWNCGFLSVLVYNIISILLIIFLDIQFSPKKNETSKTTKNNQTNNDILSKQSNNSSGNMHSDSNLYHNVPLLSKQNNILNNIPHIFYRIKNTIIENMHISFLLLVIAAITFKVSDAMMRKMINSFYANMGFHMSKIITMIHTIGMIFIALGGILINLVIKKIPLKTSFVLVFVIHSLCNLFYIVIYCNVDYVQYAQYCIILDSFTAGMLSTIFACIIHNICAGNATKYSAIWSLNTISATIFKISSGAIVDTMGWLVFFSLLQIINIICIISTCNLLYIIDLYNKNNTK